MTEGGAAESARAGEDVASGELPVVDVEQLEEVLAEHEERARDEQREVYRSIDLALRIGEVVLSSGAGTADATATILGVTAACGLRGCEVDITFT